MAVKTNVTSATLQRLITQAAAILNEELSTGLAQLGEECVKRIREKRDNWMDQTGNLRSSIGYAVFEHGKEFISSAFEVVKDGHEGHQKGREYVESLAKQYAKTYALCVVAGMDYAEHVENLPGHEVLESTEIWARAEIDKVMKKYQGRAERRITALFKQL